MSQAKDRPSPYSMYKENLDKNSKKTRFKRLFPERTPQWVFLLTLIQRYMHFPSLYNNFTHIFSLITRLSNGSKHSWILLIGSNFWKFSKISKGIFQFVVSTCPYMFTWPKISGYAQKLAAVCVFYLILLAYLAKHLRTRTHNQCSLWFVLVDTCLLACLAPNFGTCTKFQCSLWFLTLPYLLTWPRISGHARSLPVVCGFLLLSTCLLAQENPNFRIRAKNLCSLWFLLVHTCLLGQEFQDTREVCLWFVVFYF